MLIEQKTEWKTPELIVLVRSRPEEAVLTGCKTMALTGSAATVNGCASYKRQNKNFTCIAGGCAADVSS